MSLRGSADWRALNDTPMDAAAESMCSGADGGAETLSVPNEHSGQCGCRCLAPESSEDLPGSPAIDLTPCAVHISVSGENPVGFALASNGHSALSAMARMASQEVNRICDFLRSIAGVCNTRVFGDATRPINKDSKSLLSDANQMPEEPRQCLIYKHLLHDKQDRQVQAHVEHG